MRRILGWAACVLAAAACSSSKPSTTDAPAADTWASYASGFFATYCNSCHSTSDTTGRDFNMQAIVDANAAEIRCGVAVAQDPSWGCASTPVAKQFPIGSGPKPTDAERTRLGAWITAGTP